MKIYTKTGDKGQTSLHGGERIPKDHIRLEAYGSVDELVANLGVLIDVVITDEALKTLKLVQGKLMVMASLLATQKEKLLEQLPKIWPEDINFLESEIDRLNDELPELRSFIIPGGYLASSQIHVVRTVCRRAERRVISLSHEVDVDILIIKYLNRLSDYLFTLARYIQHYYNKPDNIWNPEDYMQKS